jgi:small-conductance mechanosensitive channel
MQRFEQIIGAKKIPHATESIFANVLMQEKVKQLKSLQEERDQIKEQHRQEVASIHTLLETLKSEMDHIKEQQYKRPEDDTLSQTSTILNETYQVVNDIQRIREKIVTLLGDFIKSLSAFIEDKDFSTFKKEKLQDFLIYSFEDLQKLHEMILDQEKRVTQFAEQENNSKVELDNLKRSIAATKEAYKKRQEDRADKVNNTAPTDERAITLINAEDRLYKQKQRRDEIQLRFVTQQVAYLGFQHFIAKAQLDILKEHKNKIKGSIKVTESSVIQAQEDFKIKQRDYFNSKEQFRHEIDQLTLDQKKIEQEAQELSKHYDIALGPDIDDWSYAPKKTASSYVGLCYVGFANTELNTVKQKQELAEAQGALLDAQALYEKMQVRIKESYYKISSRSLNSDEALAREIKLYDEPKSEAQVALTRYKDKLARVNALLNSRKKIIDTVANLKSSIMQQRDTVFRNNETAFNQCMQVLTYTERDLQSQVSTLGKLTGIYSGITAAYASTIQVIQFIVDEFQTSPLYNRSELAIAWDAVRNSITDIRLFIDDVYSYVGQIHPLQVMTGIWTILKRPQQLFMFLILILSLIAGLFSFRWLMTLLHHVLVHVSSRHRGFLRLISLWGVVILRFLKKHSLSLSIWTLTYIVLTYEQFIDYYLVVLFYLISIPFFIYLVNRFITYVVSFNEQHDHVFLAADFQSRFAGVISFLLYTTSFIFFFRQAFMLSGYYSSEVPTILLALNFIIFQISLILLIAKDQILNLISTKSDFGMWLRTLVDKYYLLILLFVIALIVMSNPYVGYGKLVFHVLLSLIYSALLAIVLFWLHGSFKQTASRILFAKEDEGLRERFSNAKTWFGLAIIGSFIVVGLIGLIVGTHIWGPILPGAILPKITLSTVREWLHTPLIEGMEPQINIASLFKFLLFIIGGILIAQALTKFVLDKIFDILLVDTGVRYTINTITQYLVMIASIFLGFNSIGLGGPVGVLILSLSFSLGWVLKEPLSDFIAYFIILVQRPVKIGDYISIDEHTNGVVRKITPRSVIIRRKNSTTIIVPNFSIISKTIINWNYTSGFIAFGDIFIRIDYSEDPERARKYILEVLESHPNVLKNPRPIVRLDEFGIYGYTFTIRGFLSSMYVLDQWDIASDIRIKLLKKFHENQVKIARSQLPVAAESDVKGRPLHGEAEVFKANE